MYIQILCVGSLKEQYWRDASVEYEKRLQKYCTLKVEEVKEIKSVGVETIVSEEGVLLLGKQRKGAYSIALDLHGKGFSSEGFADVLSQLALYGKSQLCFFIGGSYGLSDDVLKKSDLRLSFSQMTIQHQLMRIVLLEQIYRAFKIISNEAYHK